MVACVRPSDLLPKIRALTRYQLPVSAIEHKMHERAGRVSSPEGDAEYACLQVSLTRFRKTQPPGEGRIECQGDLRAAEGRVRGVSHQGTP